MNPFVNSENNNRNYFVSVKEGEGWEGAGGGGTPVIVFLNIHFQSNTFFNRPIKGRKPQISIQSNAIQFSSCVVYNGIDDFLLKVFKVFLGGVPASFLYQSMGRFVSSLPGLEVMFPVSRGVYLIQERNSC